MPNNSENITAGFQILIKTLVPYVVAELKNTYGVNWWSSGVYSKLYADQQAFFPQAGSDEELLQKFDVALVLKTIDLNWGEVFRVQLPKACRSWVNELITTRNQWAHQSLEGLLDQDAARALDTMALVCGQVSNEAEIELQKIVRKVRYGSSEGSTATPAKKLLVVKKVPSAKTSVNVLSTGPVSGLKSWRHVMEPHPDVAEGRYRNAEFAANLSQVADGSATSEYRDPVEFFNRTYVTAGMRGLLLEALKRVTRKGGEPIIQLKTAFGGGKTHSMLALYHLLNNKSSALVASLDNVKSIVQEAGVSVIPNVKIAVLVGTAYNPASFRRPATIPGIQVNTLWGEMAFQLALEAHDPSLYEIIRESDKRGVSPGSDALKELFDSCGPCLILIDELVAYVRKLYGKQGLPAGTFENMISFIQELTEAAKASRDTVVVASIPESEMEVGGEAGQLALETIEHTFGRMESIWKPVASNESFEVVRRRLFLKCNDIVARDAACEAFSKLYQDNPEKFPIESKEKDYLEQMKSCYPIHPEVFERLYEDWSTLEKFQRTRGVLRLMAAVINDLWENNDQSLMILSGSTSIGNPIIKEELMRYLPQTWNSIIDSEVDGKDSSPFKIDSENMRFGKILAARRVARTLFLGSAPSNGVRNRGVEKSHVYLGCVQPGENVFDFKDALKTLLNKLSYLYDNETNDKYWYDTRPTLRKLMEDRANQLKISKAYQEIEYQLKQTRKGAILNKVHFCPNNSLDIPDEQEVRLVVLSPEAVYRPEDSNEGTALSTIRNFLDTRGTGPRMYKNMLLFMAPDAEGMISLIEEAKRYLAWHSIKNDIAALDLGTNDAKDVEQGLKRSAETMTSRLQHAYSWLIVPTTELENSTSTVLVPNQVSVSDSFIASAEVQMRQDDSLIQTYAPASLLIELNKLLWKGKDSISIKELWSYFCSYSYLPRLKSFAVLEQAICNGVASKEYFGLAAGIAEDGHFMDLKINSVCMALNREDLLVKASVALKQLEENNPTGEPELPKGDELGGLFGGQDPKGPNPFGQPAPFGGSRGGNTHTPIEITPTSFYLSTPIDQTRVARDVSKIVEEILQNLQSLRGSDIKIKLEVQAELPQGSVTKEVQRTVEENCRTLSVEQYGFEA